MTTPVWCQPHTYLGWFAWRAGRTKDAAAFPTLPFLGPRTGELAAAAQAAVATHPGTLLRLADTAEKRKMTMDKEDKNTVLKKIEKENREQTRALFASVGGKEGGGPNANDIFTGMNEPGMTHSWRSTPFIETCESDQFEVESYFQHNVVASDDDPPRHHLLQSLPAAPRRTPRSVLLFFFFFLLFLVRDASSSSFLCTDDMHTSNVIQFDPSLLSSLITMDVQHPLHFTALPPEVLWRRDIAGLPSSDRPVLFDYSVPVPDIVLCNRKVLPSNSIYRPSATFCAPFRHVTDTHSSGWYDTGSMPPPIELSMTPPNTGEETYEFWSEFSSATVSSSGVSSSSSSPPPIRYRTCAKRFTLLFHRASTQTTYAHFPSSPSHLSLSVSKFSPVLTDLLDPVVSQHLRAFGEWEDNVPSLLSYALRPGSTAYECGGHIGSHTSLIARMVSSYRSGDGGGGGGGGAPSSFGHVHTFEVNPRTRLILSANVLLSGMCDNVSIHAIGVGSDEDDGHTIRLGLGRNPAFKTFNEVLDKMGGISSNSGSFSIAGQPHLPPTPNTKEKEERGGSSKQQPQQQQHEHHHHQNNRSNERLVSLYSLDRLRSLGLLSPGSRCPAVIKTDIEGMDIRALQGAIKIIEECTPMLYLEAPAPFREMWAVLNETVLERVRENRARIGETAGKYTCYYDNFRSTPSKAESFLRPAETQYTYLPHEHEQHPTERVGSVSLNWVCVWLQVVVEEDESCGSSAADPCKSASPPFLHSRPVNRNPLQDFVDSGAIWEVIDVHTDALFKGFDIEGFTCKDVELQFRADGFYSDAFGGSPDASMCGNGQH